MNSFKRVGIATAAVAIVMLGAASFAWACTTQAFVSGLSPEFGPSGTRVTVTGERFTPGPVQVRWNGTNGPVLATTNGPNFSVTITIPAATPDFYTILAVGTEGRAPATFEVTPASATESGGFRSSPTSGSSTTPSGSSTEGSTTAPSSGTSAGTSSQPSSTAGTQAAPAGSGGASFAEPGQAGIPAEAGATTAEPSATASPAGAGATAAAGSAEVNRTPSNQTSTAGSPSPSGATEPTLAAAADDQATVSPRSAWGDLQSGFAEGPSRSASLIDEGPASSGPSPAVVGALMLSGGLAAMSAGFGIAGARRRRVEVSAQA